MEREGGGQVTEEREMKGAVKKTDTKGTPRGARITCEERGDKEHEETPTKQGQWGNALKERSDAQIHVMRQPGDGHAPVQRARKFSAVLGTTSAKSYTDVRASTEGTA